MQEARLDDIDRRIAQETADREQDVAGLRESILSDRSDIDFLLWADRRSMVYNGTLLSVHTGTDHDLSCYFQKALNLEPTDPAFMFKTGFTYRLSAAQTDLSGPDGETVSLYPNDIITFCRDARLSSVCAADFDVINDYNAEIYNLQTALCAEIQDLSAALSGEIEGLSAELTGLVGSTSAEITGMISSVSSDLSAAIDAKFALSVNLSGLSGDFCDLSGFVGRTLADYGEPKPGVMKLQDEHYYDREEPLRNYEMHMISGPIKLVKTA